MPVIGNPLGTHDLVSTKQVGEGLIITTSRFTDVITLAKEHTIRAQAREDKPCILDQDAVKSNDFFEREFVFPGLENSLSPTFQPVTRHALTFDLEARTTVSQ
jgi:hypothetical protein